MRRTRARLPRTAAGGFTLLEVLTALVIGSLLVVFVQQAFVMAARSTERVHAVTSDVLRNSIAHDAVRQLLAGTRPQVKVAEERFTGGPERLSGLTSSPLLSPGIARFTLELRDAGAVRELVYREGARAAVLFELAGKPRFRYLDEQRRSYDEWTGTGATGDVPLPAWVAIEDDAGRAHLVTALPRVMPPAESVPLEGVRP